MDLSFITAPITAFFRDRVFGHLPSTLVSLLVAVLGAVATWLHDLPVPPQYQLAVYIGLAVLAAIGAAYKPAPKAAPPAGFARLGLLVLLVVVLLGAASAARAQEPKFGGCLTGGETCFAPAVSVSLVAVDLKDGSVTTSVSPGLGYEVTFNSTRWYKVGIAGFATFRDTSAGQRIVASGAISFAEYLRAGLGWQVGPGTKPFLLLGIGADFGSVPTGR